MLSTFGIDGLCQPISQVCTLDNFTALRGQYKSLAPNEHVLVEKLNRGQMYTDDSAFRARPFMRQP